eukprot:SAG11_NODE_3504_length_2407_cov_3.710572_1_plen_581_part_00
MAVALMCDGATSMLVLAMPRHDDGVIASHTDDTCQIDNGVLLDSPNIKSYAAVANPNACCALCATTPACVAWTITGLMSPGQQICGLKASVGHQHLTTNATSGILGNASHFFTHYGNPYPASWTNASGSACQADEIEFEMNGVRGSFCSPACTSDGTTSGHCPQDLPSGVTATPQCIVRDPIGSGSHCALTCTTDAECGATAKCIEKYDDAICMYPRDRADFASGAVLAKLQASEQRLNATESELTEKFDATERRLVDKIENLTNSIHQNMTNQLSGAMKISTLNVQTSPPHAPSLLPECYTEQTGHMINLHIGDSFETTLICSLDNERADSVAYIWNTAYALLTIHTYEDVSIHAISLVVWADAPIMVQKNGSLELRLMQFTKPITVASEAVFKAHSLLFVDVLGPALQVDGAATVCNSTFIGCHGDNQAGSAIHVGKGQMCCQKISPSSTSCHLCPNSATLSVSDSSFVTNTASRTAQGAPTKAAGAIFLDLPQEYDGQRGIPGIAAKLTIGGNTRFEGNKGGCKPPTSGGSTPNPDTNCDAIWWSKPETGGGSRPKQGYSNADADDDQPIGVPVSCI